MRPLRTLSVLLALVLLSGRLVPLNAQVNAVYFESNLGSMANQNSIYGFSNDGRGNLIALPNSPYLTGGTGVYDPGGLSTAFDADQQIIINAPGTLLFAVNGDSNNISVFNINSDASLTPAAGSPFASGGSDPVSLSLDETSSPALLAVVNKAADPNQTDGLPNYATFFVSSGGALTPTGNTVNVAIGANPSQVILHLAGHLMFADDFQGGTMSTYRYTSAGSMTFLSSVMPSMGGNFLGMALHPTQPVLYAATPSPVQGMNYMSAYAYQASTGTMVLQNTVSNQGLATCWISVNANGTRFYDTETVSNTVSVYNITTAKAPIFQQQVTLPPRGTPTNLEIDPTQKFLYVLQDKGVKQDILSSPVQAKLVVLAISADGSLTAKTQVPITLPAGETPVGLAVLMK